MAMPAILRKALLTPPTLRMIHIGSSRNALQTDFFHKSLPKLPITSLEQAMASFLNVRKAVLEPGQYKELESLANTFVQGNGKTLHEYLVHSYNKGDVTKYGWDLENKDILRERDPLFYQVGGCLIFDLGKNESQFVRASKLIQSAAKVAIKLRNNTFPPLVRNYNPLFENVLKETDKNSRTQVAYGLGMIPITMDGHPKILGSSRIPNLSIDSIKRSDTSKNVVIIRNGHLFSFDVISDNGEVISTDKIFNVLRKIEGESAIPCPTPVAALTCLDRTSWAKHRDHLLTDQHNSELLKVLEESLAVLTLDGQLGKERVEKDIYLGRNPGDRWFDKGVFFSIDENSPYTGINGNAVESHLSIGADYVHAMTKDYDATTTLQVRDTAESPLLKRLQFNIDDFTDSGIQSGKKIFNKFYSEFQYEGFKIPELTNTEFKKRLLNPSSMIQLAAQTSFIKLEGRPQITDAVTLLPSFVNGHIQLHKSPSPIMVSLAKTFAQGKKIDMSLLRKCCDAYYSEILQMRMGLHLADTLLSALEQLSEEQGYECDFFSSELYRKQRERLYVVTIPHHVAKNVVYSHDPGTFAMLYLFGKNGMSGNISAVDSPNGAPIKEYCKHFIETMHELVDFISKQD